MREGNVETIRDVYEHWGAGDFRAGASLFEPASVFILSPDFPDSGIYVGADAVVGYMRGFLEPWENLTITALEFSVFGDTVVVEVQQQGKGRLSGADTGFSYFQLWTFRGETLTRLENLMTREEAMAAVGG